MRYDGKNDGGYGQWDTECHTKKAEYLSCHSVIVIVGLTDEPHPTTEPYQDKCQHPRYRRRFNHGNRRTGLPT